MRSVIIVPSWHLYDRRNSRCKKALIKIKLSKKGRETEIGHRYSDGVMHMAKRELGLVR